ncbi:hypothetical protein B0A48_01591 [Cryoendolithus antarcticus]|uniref:Mannan endo-1,6-alpha-mannosidase n=1 Tax=Cryoendolithus antarcticus TaxID=1507870 RepID=A0A1V8TPP5_9PEZI|nr:hypothetical protein B0A48_01591 [Cryoendolithus antarcticus]
MRLHHAALAALSTPFTTALNLDVNSTSSLSNASSTIVHGLMSWYQNNASSTPPTAIGTLPAPLYWWEAGAVWGGMLDYWAYTNDTSYNPTMTQALLAQVGPNNDYMPPAYFTSLGNDDQAFWAFAVLTALEYGYLSPLNSTTQWLDLAVAVWNTQVRRWDTTSCGGGLKWQVFQSNAGFNYKNTVSNGAFFQISARLARYTGNQTYVEWAGRSWDWMNATGLFDAQYNVFDGSDDLINCTRVDHTAWTYNPAILMYGSAMMYNYTNGSAVWEERLSGLLGASVRNFFSVENATNVLYEFACEPENTCNNDQFSFKAYMSRWLAKSAIIAPYILPEVRTLLTLSALAAAQSCSGGNDGTTCGQKWYVGGYDGSYGVGQQLSALETVQALLLLGSEQGRLAPRVGSGVVIGQATKTSTFVLQSQTAAPGGGGSGSGTRSADANSANRQRMRSWDAWPVLGLPVMVMVFGAGILGMER